MTLDIFVAEQVGQNLECISRAFVEIEVYYGSRDVAGGECRPSSRFR